MGHQVTIGGERLGSGKKQKVTLHAFERSTHDIGYVWRSTMASGTLVPFMSEIALPGDTFDINLNVDVLTHPTIGPLFGSYKVQLDVFQVPIRLYQGLLHMNMLGIGLDMSQVLLPLIEMYGPPIDETKPIDNQHTNPSSILAYLGIRGTGHNGTGANPGTVIGRKFNAIPFLGYWDIYKNYYANKQEEIGYVIHKAPEDQPVTITTCNIVNALPDITIPPNAVPPLTYTPTQFTSETRMEISGTGFTATTDPANFLIQAQLQQIPVEFTATRKATDLFKDWYIDVPSQLIIGTNPVNTQFTVGYGNIYFNQDEQGFDTEPTAVPFPLENIDNMRKAILAKTDGTEFIVNKTQDPNQAPGTYLEPYSMPFETAIIGAGPDIRYSQLYSQEGLALKTYNSDLFNNWIQTEWIDGVDGISEITKVDTSSGGFTIDELNLNKKIYDMLNRIAISGGSYDDWLDAVYTHERTRSAENPMYLGGLIQTLAFQEVISNAQTVQQPLGTLAGRGKMTGEQKGGKIIAKVDEPSYIIGIVSITPRVDYSQGNKWDTNLKTMNDLHKPSLDAIGFQDLLTDQMAWWDTAGGIGDFNTTFKSAGKQPAWINYMTNVNVVRGNFAEPTEQMFMVLNRRYDPQYGAVPTINDLTTYIDPTKFNHIFANTRRDAQNFWTQIGVNIEARRKMSAKVIPNL